MTPQREIRRWEIINKNPDYRGGICTIAITREQLQRLVNEGFAKLDECQNSGPSIREFLDADFPLIFTGYVVAPDRSDCRITIDGLKLESADPYIQLEFMERFHHADELSRDYAWWD